MQGPLSSPKKKLIITGLVVFLCGLVTGGLIPVFTNSRMGLAAHLAGVQNGMVLLIVAAIWDHIRLGQRMQRISIWLLSGGLIGIFVALILSAIWGTSKSTPIAGAGHVGTATHESIVRVLLMASSVATILGTAIVLFGALANRDAE